MTARAWPRFAIALLLAAALPPVLGRIGVLNDFRALSLGTAVAIGTAALALNLLMGYAGQVSLGHFALVGVGAFTSGVLTAPTRSDLPFAVGALAAALVGGAIAFLLGLPALRLRGLYLAVVTMAFAFVMTESLFRWRWLSRGSAGIEIPRPYVGSFGFTRNADYLAVVLVLLVLVWLLDSNVTATKLGRAFHAIRADEVMAASFGIDVTRYKLLAFTVSGAVAGLAGAMYGHLFQFVTASTFGFDRSLLLVIVVVVGGLGSRAGVITSALFYALFPIVFINAFGNGWQGVDLIVGAVLLMFTVSRHPGGLAEAVRDAAARRRSRGAATPSPAAGTEADLPRLADLPRPTLPATRTIEIAGTPLLSAREIVVTFGGVRAVDEMSLDVHRGRIVGLIGPNGAGKTTLFNAMAGALEPASGQVHLLGRDITTAPAHVRTTLGMARSFQLIGLAKDLSLTENLLLAQHQVAGYGWGWALAGLGPAARVESELRARAAEAIAALGFERDAHTPVRLLSQGQQRIVEIACLLMTAPELVMLDEPSAGMAPGAVEHLATRLRDVRGEMGRTVLLIEHNIPLVLDVCDEVYVMAAGRLLAHGSPADIVRRDDVVAAYLGEDAA